MKKILLSAAVLFSMLHGGGDLIEPVSPVTPIVPTVEPLLNSDSGFYLGGAVGLVSAREAKVDLDFFEDKRGQDRLGSIILLGGYDFNKYVSIEGRASVSIAGEDYAKLKSFSLFVKPKYPLNDKITLYGLLGFGYVKLDNKNRSNVDVSKASFQWGLGASYNINNKWSVFADYTSLANDVSGKFLRSKKADVDSINIGLLYKF